MTNDGDALLLWAIGERAGSISSLADRLLWFASVTNVPLPLPKGSEYMWIQDMAALAYLDVDWVHNKWSVAPPVLTRLPAADGLLLMTGGRTGGLSRALIDLRADCDIWFCGPSTSSPLPLAQSVYVQPKNESAVRAVLDELTASEPDLSFTSCSAIALSVLLGKSEDFLLDIGGPVGDEGGTLHVMNAANLWTIPGGSNASMWRLTREAVAGAVHRWNSRTGKRFGLLTPTGWIGGSRPAVIYAGLECAGANVLEWQPDAHVTGIGTLLVPMKLGLPAMHDRAVTLATGLRPTRGATVLKYRGIPIEIGSSIARSLGQRLTEVHTQT